MDLLVINPGWMSSFFAKSGLFAVVTTFSGQTPHVDICVYVPKQVFRNFAGSGLKVALENPFSYKGRMRLKCWII